jgi:hypothetical protein
MPTQGGYLRFTGFSETRLLELPARLTLPACYDLQPKSLSMKAVFGAGLACLTPLTSEC